MRIGAQAEQQRRILAPQPLQDLARRARVRPRLGVRGGDLAAVRERSFARRPRLPVDDRDLVPVFGEIPRGGDADTPAPSTRTRIVTAAPRRRPALPARLRASVYPPSGCSCRRGCDRRRRCRRARPAASISRRAATRPDTRPPRAGTRGFQSSRATAAAVCGACFSGLSARSARPSSIARISARIAIIAVDEAVELGLRFAFGRLDHQRPGDREAHRRRVEAVVHEPLGDIVDGDLRRFLHRPQIEDAFVRDEPARPGIEHRIVRRRGASRRSSPRGSRSRSPR